MIGAGRCVFRTTIGRRTGAIDARDPKPINPVTDTLSHLEAQTPRLERFSLGWDAAEMDNHKASNRVKVTLRQVGPTEEVASFVYRESAVEQPGTIRLPGRTCGLVVWAVGKVAQYRLKKIGECKKAPNSPEFVKYDGGVRSRCPEDLQDFQTACSLIQQGGESEASLNPKGLIAGSMAEQVLDMDDSHQMIQDLVTDRKPRMRRANHLTADLLGRVGGVDPDDLIARSHQLPGSSPAKAKNPFDHFLLSRVEDSSAGALAHQLLDGLARDRALTRSPKADDLEEKGKGRRHTLPSPDNEESGHNCNHYPTGPKSVASDGPRAPTNTRLSVRRSGSGGVRDGPAPAGPADTVGRPATGL